MQIVWYKDGVRQTLNQVLNLSDDPDLRDTTIDFRGIDFISIHGDEITLMNPPHDIVEWKDSLRKSLVSRNYFVLYGRGQFDYETQSQSELFVDVAH